MPVLTSPVASDQMGVARRPRDDVVVEVADGPDRFVAVAGPFVDYERTLLSGGEGVTERIDYRLAPLVWGPFPALYRRALLRPHPTGRRSWWFPPETADGHGATSLGALTLLAIILGYLGSLLTQTITFAADEFDASRSNQSATLAAVRIGVLGALALAALADRRGRRKVLLWATTAACVLTIVSALAPGLVALGTIQAVVRGLATAASILLTIVAAEEMPAGSRAFGVSLLAVTGALGVGLVVFALPIADATGDGRRVLCVLPILVLLTAVAADAAREHERPHAGAMIVVGLGVAVGIGFLVFAGPLADTGARGWRIIFVLPVLFLPVLWRIGRTLPESRRFVVPHADAGMAGHGRRFWMLAASAFLLALFTAPASQLMNEFLRDERGFSAARISLFTILTNTPGGLGIVIGGQLADVRGRRIVGAVGTTAGVLLTVAMVLSSGWPMWILSVLGAIMGAMVVPALGVYGPELFPTSLRGKANGIITIVGVGGSVLGLLVAGFLSDRWDGLGPALCVLAIGPLLMAVLVLVAYPETAHRELEDINPEDRLDAPGATPSRAAPPVD